MSANPIPFAHDRELVLPPLPIAGPPLVFRVKLTDDFVREMIEAEELHLELTTQTNGTLFVDTQPSELFLRHAEKSKPALEFCLSYRGDSVRSIAPIVGEVDVKRRMSKGVSSITKKRKIEAENQTKAHTMKKLNEGEEPRAKNTKVRPPVKRARVASGRHTDVVKPTLQPTTTGLLNGASALLQRRLPVSVPSNSPSPHVSPPGYPRAPAALRSSNPQHPMSRQGTPPSTVIPPSVPAIRPATNPSPAGSRLPTPSKITSAPSSPRVGAMRAKVDLRRDLAHLLALQDMSVTELTKRLGPGRGDYEEVRKAVKAVGETGREVGKYTLRSECWSEVGPDYSGYSEPERVFIRSKVEGMPGRSTNGSAAAGHSRVSALSGSGSNGNSTSQGSAVSPSGDMTLRAQAVRINRPEPMRGIVIPPPDVPPVDPGLESYVSDILKKSELKLVKPPIQTSEDEQKYRAAFASEWARYCALHTALDGIQKAMGEITAYRSKVSRPSDFDVLDDAAASFLNETKDRWERYCRALGKVQRRLESIKQRVGQWCAQ